MTCRCADFSPSVCASPPARNRRTGASASARQRVRGTVPADFSRRVQGRRGFSYLEASISALILGLGVTASMNLYGSFIRGAAAEKERHAAMDLAGDLLAEVLTRGFEESGVAEGSFGAESGEIARRFLDDVDDYHGWVESPPQNLDGTAMTGYANYRREVRVWNVQLSDLKTVASNGSTPAKVIEVRVLVSGKLRATVMGYRARHEGYK